jgi:hypothetical protein
MITCGLCGEAKDCLEKEIVCSECLKPLEQKLRSKGRAKKELVLLPPPRERTEREDNPAPGEPPKIWGAKPN